MDKQNDDLLRLTLKERDAGAAVLGRAFVERFRYYFPDETQRRAVADTSCFIVFSVCLKYGEVYASSEKIEGVAAWLPPGKEVTLGTPASHTLGRAPDPCQVRTPGGRQDVDLRQVR